MLSKKLFTALLVIAAVGASGSPMEVEEDSILLCVDDNLQKCENPSPVVEECENLRGNFLDKKISSVFTHSRMECQFWKSYKCEGDGWIKLRYPGNWYLGGINFGDAISSYKCYEAPP